MNINIDSKMSDADRRRNIFNGSIFVHAPCASALKLCELAQELIEDAFPSQDPLKGARLVIGRKVRGNSW